MNRDGVSTDRRVLAIAVPAFAALVTEPLMLLVDTAVVGHLGTPELAGLAVGGTVLTTVVGLCVFLAYGTTAAVARRQGAGRDDLAMATALAGVWLALLIGIALAAVLVLVSGPVARGLSSSADVAGHAQTYLAVGALGLPGLLLLLAATGALRGVLDLRTPLLVAVTANVLNAVLSVALVHGLGWGVAGAAVGTVVAQTAGALWLVTVLVRRARGTGTVLRPRWGAVIAAGRDGLPLLVRTGLLRAALLLATGVAASLGDTALAAHQVAVSLVALLAFALDALAIAGQTLTGRALGAGDIALTQALTARMVTWGAAAGVLLGLVLLAGSSLLPRLFTTDPDVRAMLVSVLVVVALIQPISGIVFVLDGILIGAGDGAYLARAGVVALAAYAPWAVAVGLLGAGLTWLWIAYGVFMAARLATLWHRRRGTVWLLTE